MDKKRKSKTAKLTYQTGFGNTFCSEAAKGALGAVAIRFLISSLPG